MACANKGEFMEGAMETLPQAASAHTMCHDAKMDAGSDEKVVKSDVSDNDVGGLASFHRHIG